MEKNRKVKLLESLERHYDLIFSCLDTYVLDYKDIPHMKHVEAHGSG